jgi:hypothetical protein
LRTSPNAKGAWICHPSTKVEVAVGAQVVSKTLLGCHPSTNIEASVGNQIISRVFSGVVILLGDAIKRGGE